MGRAAAAEPLLPSRPTGAVNAAAAFPTSLTAFIGRARERAALSDAVRAHRLVTATGAGGVGKTRLSLAVAEDLAAEHRDGVAFVDLVAIVDPDMVVGAVADAVGVAERAGISREDALTGALASAELLLVVDNCEHVLESARMCVRRVLAACPAVRILATSRTRLLLAGETVFPVPGLAIDDACDDAVELFVDRLVASGAPALTDAVERATARDICQSLDGIALAIELAAARVPSLGLDGLRYALGQGHELLTFGPSAGERHASLRTAIDWSYRLLDEDERSVLRAVSVFAAPLDLDAAAAVLERPARSLLSVLGHLVDWNLVALHPGRPSRYRVLETIRQYAGERSDEIGELDQLRARHLAWCRRALHMLLAGRTDDVAWLAEVDRIVDEASAALTWATDREELRAEAADLARAMADASFQWGRPGEAQRRYTQAAELADTAARRHEWLRLAARCALARYLGDEAVALLDEAATTALAAGDDALAAADIGHQVIIRHRHSGTMTKPISTEQTDQLLDRARLLGTGSATVEAVNAVAEVSRGDAVPTRSAVEHAVELALATRDELLVDAAFDQLCAIQLVNGDLAAAAATVGERLIALSRVPVDAGSGMDHADARLMAVHVDLAAGRMRSARRHADALADLMFLRDEPHVPLGRRLEVSALAGDFEDVAHIAGILRESWLRAGRPTINSQAQAAYATAMAYGILDLPDERAEWIGITRALLRDPTDLDDAALLWPATFDAFVALHTGDAAAALERLTVEPDRIPVRFGWHQALWRPWYAAAWGEASGLADHPEADDRLRRAEPSARGNDIALAILERTAAIRRGDTNDVDMLADRFAEAGCRYQEERTRQLLGPTDQAVPTSADGLDHLSLREREVLRLVAAGCTNPQIAAELYISRKTAEHHVSHILSKLGVTTRAEAAALAGRRGLG